MAVSRGDRLWLVDAATGSGRELARQGGGQVTEADWSPDGRLLAVARSALVDSLDGVRVDGLPGLYRSHRRIQVVDVDGRPRWTLPGDAY